MNNRIGMALIGIGAGAVPHLRSLHDLRDTIELRHAVTRRPERADMGPFNAGPSLGAWRWASALSPDGHAPLGDAVRRLGT